MRNITYGAHGSVGSFERAVHYRVVHLKEPFKRLALFYTVKVNGSLQRAVQSRSLQGAVQKSRLVHDRHITTVCVRSSELVATGGGDLTLYLASVE